MRAGAAQTQLLEEIKLKAEIRVVVQILLEVQTLTSLSSTGALFVCLDSVIQHILGLCFGTDTGLNT